MVSRDDLVSRFGIPDYVVFVLMLCVSAGIGFYFALSGNRQRTAGEFLMANRSMGILPISLSLLASFLSAIGLLGIPAETYVFGTSYWTMSLCFLIVMPVSAYLYLPVFYDLELTSAYEYLERRFNTTVRKCGSAIFIFQMTMYMSMVTYAPSLALSQVTGLHVWGSVAAIGVVCTFYTTVGGMKAVMWTDAFQICVMLAAMLAVIIQGVLTLGGFEGVWAKAMEGGRIDGFNFDTNPLVRHTFWNLIFGGAVTWLAIYGVNQTQVQRYLTSPSLRSAQISVLMNLPGLFLTFTLCTMAGLVIYAQYSTCDPVAAHVIKSTDQLLPLLVMDILGVFPGLPGFFVAGIFSGSLSTLSSGLNSLAAVTLEDFVKALCLKNLTEERAGLVSKLLALLYGVVSLALVAVAEQLGNILQAALSIFGMIGGPLFGLFTLGMFFPWANSAGAMAGLTSGLGLILWIGIGAQVVKPFTPKLGVSVDGCNFTDIVYNITIPVEKEVFPIYKVSYQWYSSIAFSTVIVVGLIVSFLTGHQDPRELDARLLSPPVRKLGKMLPKRFRNFLQYSFKEESVNGHQKGNGTVNGVHRRTSEEGADNLGFKSEDRDLAFDNGKYHNGIHTSHF